MKTKHTVLAGVVMIAVGLPIAAARTMSDAPLDSTRRAGQPYAMKLKAPRAVRKTAQVRAAKRARPSVAAWTKRISGMMEGARDLSSREGFGR